MRLINFFVDYKRTTIALLCMIFLYGYFAFLNIAKESAPEIEIPVVHVVVTMNGISPEDSERMLVKPIENAVKTISGIKSIKSFASEGAGIVIVEFHPEIQKSKAIQDVRDKANSVTGDLPKDADRPVVNEVSMDQLPVVNIGLSGEISERALIKIARDLESKISSIPEVLDVSINGDLEDVIEIIVSPDKIENNNISLQLLGNIINQNNKIVRAGLMRGQNGEYSIKIPSLVTNYNELLNFPIANNSSNLKIKDIAEVRQTYKERKQFARINGKSAVVLGVSKRSGSNIIDTVAKVKQIVMAESKYFPQELKITFSQDESNKISNMLLDLGNSIILATILVIIVIMIGVGFKSALLISLSLPSSFLASILLLYITGNTMNIVVLFSLILSVGMIVDDAIVVSEYADRKMIEGAKPKEAYLEAAIRMFWPIVTSTVVKLLVFAPLLFWPGMIGQFMKYMPITVITVLTSSLIFALLFQPSLGSVLIKKHDPVTKKAMKSMLAAETGNIQDLSGFSKKYANALIKILQFPKIFVSTILGAIVGIYIFFFTLGTGVEFFPAVEPDNAQIVIRAPGNLSIFQKNELVQQVEDKIKDMNDEIRIFYTQVGDVGSGQQDSVPADTIGLITLEFQEWNQRRKANIILDEIKEKTKNIQGIKIQSQLSKEGPNEAKPIRIEVASKDYSKIETFLNKLEAAMEEMSGFKDIEDYRPIPAIEWQFYVDRELATQYGVSISDVGNILNMATDGYKVSSIRIDDVDDEIDIMVRFPEDARKISALDHLKVVNLQGNAIPLSIFTKKIAKQQVTTKKRIDQFPVITLKSDVETGVLPDSKIQEIQKWFAENYDPEIQLMFKGDKENQEETGAFLKNAFGTALIMMSLVMLLQFNTFYHTFIVMSAVFISTAGVLIGLLISWQPFGIVMSGVGTIALAGIVLNNNILLIDTYNHLRREGFEVYDSVVRASIQRMRPILLTAITAILGLLPMIIGLTVDFVNREITQGAPSTQWWTQLAASIAGGLAFATALTLFFTPALLILMKRFDSRSFTPNPPNLSNPSNHSNRPNHSNHSY